jgi:putative DNA primase/helicase
VVAAARRSGALLPLDELSQADAHAAGKAVYMLANESGKARMDAKGNEKPLLTWELIFLSRGEKTLADRMGEVGGAPNAGQEVRMVNIPSDMGCGWGAYRELHGMKDGAALSDHLEQAAKKFYGTAGRAFIKEIADARALSPDGLIAGINAERDRFLQANAKLLKGANGQVRSVAKRFGLFAAAGELACYMGILPWPLGEAHLAATAGLQAWIDSRGGTGAAEDTQALAMVRRFIATHSESRFLELSQLTKMGAIPTEGGKAASAAEGPPDGIYDKWRTVNKAGYKRLVDDG